LTIPKLPKAHITFTNDGSARASSSGTALLPAKSAGSSSHRATPSLKGKEKAVELEPDNIPYEREMSKREKAHVSDRSSTRLLVYLQLFSNPAKQPPRNCGHRCQRREAMFYLK
jgi:hypothetical protein